jgi:hypothetical protein
MNESWIRGSAFTGCTSMARRLECFTRSYFVEHLLRFMMSLSVTVNRVIIPQFRLALHLGRDDGSPHSRYFIKKLQPDSCVMK